MKKKYLFLCFWGFLTLCVYAKPKMVKLNVPDNSKSMQNILIEMSEKNITIEDYEQFVMETSKEDIKTLESRWLRRIDSNKKEVDKTWPMFYLTWRDAVLYCNWLSKKDGYVPFYIIKTDPDNSKNVLISSNLESNGYRLPYVRELLVVSNCSEKDETSIKAQNNLELKSQNGMPLSVENGKKNDFGIYDVLGNIPELCCDFYNEKFDYKNMNLSYTGPDSCTPDPDQVYFKEYLTNVRCVFGGYYWYSVKKVLDNLIKPINEIEQDYVSFRIVRRLN